MSEAPHIELEGAAALVTGGARRLGRAIALALAEAGARVVVHYNRSAADAERTADELRAAGAEAWTVQADLQNPESVDALFDRAIEAAGPLDVLINNASIYEWGPLARTTIGEIERNLQINALAPMQLMRAFAAQNRRGAVINLTDCTVVEPDTKRAAYHLSKRMLNTLTFMAAREYAPAVRVNAVAPGLILPPSGKDTDWLEAICDTNPLGARGNAQDVVDATLYLLRARFVTGQVLFVDGGRHLKGQAYV